MMPISLKLMPKKHIMLVILSLTTFLNNEVFSQEKSFPNYKVEEVAGELSFPWSLAFLPDHQLLVTERTGSVKLIDVKGSQQVVSGLPSDIYIKSQGGLMDVLLHPNFKENGWIYLSYSAGTDNHNALKVIRAKLVGDKLLNREEILLISPNKDTPVHYAGRMTFLPDGSLLVTSGDGFDYREHAQKMTSLLGKVIRVNDDGTVPPDNPFYVSSSHGVSRPLLSSYIYSLGHRNAQAILYDPAREVIFSNEHGPDGGDELNIIQKGLNYGWPVVTNGKDYMGSRISPFTEYPDMQQPLVDWTPSIAPSGMALYDGNMFKELRGDLLVSALKFKEVRWIQMRGTEVTGQLSLFKELNERIRDVRVDADGAIYLLTDSNNGKILRITKN